MNKIKKQTAFSINFLLLLLILLFSIIYPVSVQAEGELSTVSYQYKDLETLTNLEKKDIIKGNPKEVLSNDFENYIFVYERKKTKEVNSTTPKSNINKTLPKTNEQLFNTNTLIIGLLITGLSLYIFVYKKKKIDKILIIFILLGGLGLNTYVNKVKAVEINLLKPSAIVKLPKGAVSNLEPENLSGYNYIGYIYTSENKIKPIKAEVTVYYQDVSGQPLASTEVLTGNVGDSYTSKQKDIPGYTFKEVKEDNATGKFTATSQSVHYIYTKDVVKGAEVTVYYQDVSGQPLAST
ncbi:MucBP domain-containing protein, partial [Vagococcus sp.]|uniref:MucBP domain-containing protein n=1 Tax=Vagococcus sp. TaxID=1933889 RepID=UPI003F96457A